MTRRLRRRTAWLFLGSFVAGLWLMWRVVDIQAVQGSRLSALAHSEHVTTLTLPALRGPILGRHGRVLALDVPRAEVTADPTVIAQTARLLHDPALVGQEVQRLARVLPLSPTALRAALTRPGSYVLLDDDLAPAAAKELERHASSLPGITITPVERRLYPNGSLAASVLGFVGANGQGLAGIEYEDNRILAGRPGSWTVATTVNGTPLPAWTIRRVAPQAGDGVELTLDSTIQHQVETWLAQDVQRFHAEGGTVIIMRPQTGAVLALATYPTFDPNHYARANPLAWGDWAVEDPVPPGSIFKPVTAAAALLDGVVTPTTRFDTRGYKIVDGIRINDWMPHGWGWISFTRGLELSSNQVFMDVGLKLGTARLYQMIRAFGFFHPSGIGLPGDSAGVFLPENQVNAVDLATMAFGQGLAVTPIQEVTMVNAIANGGTLLKPRIRRAVLAPDGRVVRRFHPVVEGHPIPANIVHDLHVMMEREVGYGTGVPAQVPGYTWAGKTGTAQQVVDGRTSSTDYIASYVGYGPMPHPRFTMLVMIDHPQGAIYGAQVAAPLWGRIAHWLMQYWHIRPYVHNNLPNGVPQGNAIPPRSPAGG
jgi:stage V sporulation protein D (sporulation-specific penicillin-binding protein)